MNSLKDSVSAGRMDDSESEGTNFPSESCAQLIPLSWLLNSGANMQARHPDFAIQPGL